MGLFKIEDCGKQIFLRKFEDESLVVDGGGDGDSKSNVNWKTLNNKCQLGNPLQKIFLRLLLQKSGGVLFFLGFPFYASYFIFMSLVLMRTNLVFIELSILQRLLKDPTLNFYM